MTGADYYLWETLDHYVLLTNTPAQTESQLRNIEQTTGGIGLYVNTNKSVPVL